MPYLELPDSRLYYRVDDHTDPWGRPETVLFVHGFCESTEAWRGWVPHFSRRYRVLRFDQRGFGRSGAVPEGFRFTTEGFVADLARVIEGLAREPVHLVGGKSGGISVLVLAATRPELVRTVAVVCSPVTPPRAWGWLEEMERDGVRGWARRTMRERLGNRLPEEAIEWWADLMGATALSTARAYLEWVSAIDIRDDVRRLRRPTLVVGTDTARRGRAEFESWQRTIPGSELAMLALDGYHAAGSDPDATARVVLEFIERRGREARAA